MNGTLPTWMEHWFGLSNGPGMGVAWRLDYRWPWPPWATLLAIAVVVAAIVGIYLRGSDLASRGYRMALAAMRLLALGLVLLMIAQVELFLQRTGLPFVVVIVDDTRSMSTIDHYDEGVRNALRARVLRALGAGQPPGDGKKASEAVQPPDDLKSATAGEDGGSGLKATQLSRWNVTRMLFTENDGELLSALADSHKLRLYYLSEMKESRSTDVAGIVHELKTAEPNGDSTRLGSAIRGALDELRGTTPVAIVLVTDGINTEGPGLVDAAAYARRKGVPLLLIGVGSDRPARDLQLSDLEVEEVVFVNDLVHFRFKLTAAGFAGKSVSIVLRREEHPGGASSDKGEVVARTEVRVAADGRSQEVVLPHRPAKAGQFRYTIDVEPPPGDQVTRHPPLARSIRVREEKIRVLLVEGSPRFEYRYLFNLLSRDKTIDLHVLLQGADIDFSDPGKKETGTDRGTALKIFPVRREDLLAYDVVIFGDVDPSLLSPAALQNLADFVDHQDRGGALVLLAGPNFMPQSYRDTPLARLMPFDPANARHPEPSKPLTDGFVVQPTEMGLASPSMQLGDSPEQSRAIWQKLPPMYWMTELSDLKRSARVLAEHPTRRGPDGKGLPLIMMQYVGGGGKVLFHAIDETYRWRRRVGDLYFARYWIQTLRFLSRSKLAEGDRSVRLSTDRRDYQLGEPVRLQVYFTDDRVAPLDDNGVTVELEQAGRQTQKVQLHRTEVGRGHFETVLNNLPAGGYHAKMVTPPLPGRISAADFVVAPPQAELARLQMDANEMHQAAELTKGHYYTYQDASRLIDDLPDGRQVPVESLPPAPLWNRWPLLAMFLGLLIGEWLLRKRKGMA
jgi:hypothetical protein